MRRHLDYFFGKLKWRLIWSWRGLSDNWRTQHSFRTWVWANGVSVLGLIVLPVTWLEAALVLAVGLMLLGAEALNTAIEYTVDLASPEQNPLAARAKEAGSAGVFLFSMAGLVAWVCVIGRIIWAV